jgi:hypothetical protein
MTDGRPVPHLALYRATQNAFATYGRLEAKYSTLELPWQGNAHDVSCVPATIDAQGTRMHAPYTAERYLSPDHRCVVFRLIDVPDRGYIEMHVGCLPRDTKGCILLGMAFGHVDYQDGTADGRGYGVVQSRTAFHSFMLAHPEQRFTLDIHDVAAPDPADQADGSHSHPTRTV